MGEERMLSVEEIIQAGSQDLIERQVKVRRKLIDDMVGTLYPGIVRDQIAELWEAHEQLGKGSLGPDRTTASS